MKAAAARVLVVVRADAIEGVGRDATDADQPLIDEAREGIGLGGNGMMNAASP